MDGLFRFAADPDPAWIAVVLSWQEDRRIGEIIMPQAIRAGVDAADYPPTEGPMPVEAAVAYGVFLSLKAFTPLVLAGDITAWDPRWGALLVTPTC